MKLTHSHYNYLLRKYGHRKKFHTYLQNYFHLLYSQKLSTIKKNEKFYTHFSLNYYPFFGSFLKKNTGF